MAGMGLQPVLGAGLRVDGCLPISLRHIECLRTELLRMVVQLPLCALVVPQCGVQLLQLGLFCPMLLQHALPVAV